MEANINTLAYPIYRIVNEGIQNYHNNPVARNNGFVFANLNPPSLNLPVFGLNPKLSGYWPRPYNRLPDPPPEARLQLSVSTESQGNVFINYVVWDRQNACFKRRDIHYATPLLEPAQFREQGGFEQRIRDGEVMAGGAIVDQKQGSIVLNNGLRVDGPTGNILDPAGRIVKYAMN